MTSKSFDMMSDDVVYCGPFIYTRGKMLYRDDHDTLWEIRPTDNRKVPLEIIAISQVVETDKDVTDG
jgi:hypothetical protein